MVMVYSEAAPGAGPLSADVADTGLEGIQGLIVGTGDPEGPLEMGLMAGLAGTALAA